MTVGHSNHEWAAFAQLLQEHNVTAVADVRSSPYSRVNPVYCRGPLQQRLKAADIAYVFLGQELGARRTERECYVDRRACYQRIVELPLFKEGLNRIRAGLQDHRIALLCAEKDPITCHRMVLVCRQFRADEIDIQHIREDGSLESNAAAERRMLIAVGVNSADLFIGQHELLEEAYRRQGKKIAWCEPEASSLSAAADDDQGVCA
jgi:uncharacterized protein (DUF488 family)